MKNYVRSSYRSAFLEKESHDCHDVRNVSPQPPDDLFIFSEKRERDCVHFVRVQTYRLTDLQAESFQHSIMDVRRNMKNVHVHVICK